MLLLSVSQSIRFEREFVSLTGLRFHSALFDVCSALAHVLDLNEMLDVVSLYGFARICRIVIVTKWFYLTRLETRTKESNVYASIRVLKPQCAMKVKAPGAEVGSLRGTIDRSDILG